jgi:HEAT repeat protein
MIGPARLAAGRASASSLLGSLACALLFAACGRGPAEAAAPAATPLPALQLRPMLAELRRIAATRQVPDEAAQRTLREYASVALQREQADPRTAALVTRRLLEDPQAWFVLEPALLDDDLGIRQRAAWLCGESRQAALVPSLLLRLKYELDPVAVLWVADALARLGNDAGLSWLAGAFENPDTAPQAGRMAIDALRARGVEVGDEPSWDDLRRLLDDQLRHFRATGRSRLVDEVQVDEGQLRAQLAHHLQTPEGTQLRPVDDARYILNRLGVGGVPMLMATLHAEEHYLRTMPLQVLAELGPAAVDAVPAVLPLLADPLTSSYAVRALGEIGAAEALPHIRPMLADVETELRAAATQALGLLEDAPSRAALEARLADEAEVVDVRVGAAFGLLCMGEHAAARRYLERRKAEGDYHEPTLTRLLERLAARNG